MLLFALVTAATPFPIAHGHDIETRMDRSPALSQDAWLLRAEEKEEKEEDGG